MHASTASPTANAIAPLRVLALALGLATILALMGASQSQAYYVIHHGTPPPWSQSLLFSATQWYAWAVLVPFVVMLGARFRFGGDASTIGRAWLHISFALLFALLHLLLQTTVVWFALPGGREFLGSFGTGMLTLLVTTLQWELLSYAVVLAATHIVLSLRRAQADALARHELETRAAQAQLAALQRQMQPHFLFNALNALVSMQRENSPEQRFTLRIADFLRLLLAGDSSSSTTLAIELRLVHAYLHVEQVRLDARLHVNVDIPENLGATRLPALILQPLVENAVTHGVAHDPAGGEIRVSARREGAQVVIEIVNICRSRQEALPNRGNGIALDNCRRRLALMYGDGARFESGPTSDNGFRAALILPAAPAGAAG
ncbi:MAG: histidine kinase [Rudaea sp.]